MKISEVSDKNKVFSDLSSRDLLFFDKEYPRILKLYELYSQLKRFRSLQLLRDNNITIFIQEANFILTGTFPDPTDRELIELKNKVSKMVSHLEQLRNSIK